MSTLASNIDIFAQTACTTHSAKFQAYILAVKENLGFTRELNDNEMAFVRHRFNNGVLAKDVFI